MEDQEPRPVIDTKIDPQEDLGGYLREVIAGIRSMGVTGHRRHPGHLYSHLDFVRGSPGEWDCPLWAIKPRRVWVVGQYRVTCVLAVALGTNGLLWYSMFNTSACESGWSAPALVGGVPKEIDVQHLVCSRDSDTVVLCTETSMFIRRGNLSAECVAVSTTTGKLDAVAVSQSGACVAYVRSDEPTHIGVNWFVQGDRPRLIETVFADETNITRSIGALCFNDVMRLAAASLDGTEVAVVATNSVSHSLQRTEFVAEMGVSPVALFGCAVNADSGPKMPLDERVLWVDMPDNRAVAVGSWHHMSVQNFSNGAHSCFITDSAAPVAAALVSQHFLFMDAGGTTQCYQYGCHDGEPCFLMDGPPEVPSPCDAAEPPPIDCGCRLCARRLHWTACCGRAVIIADDDLCVVWMVNPWGRVTVIRRVGVSV